MKPKPIKSIICKDHSSDIIQSYLFSIGYTWKKGEYNVDSRTYDFEKDYNLNKRFFGDIVIILLDDKTFAWENYKTFINPYSEMFRNIPYVDSETFLKNSRRKEKLKRLNKKAS